MTSHFIVTRYIVSISLTRFVNVNVIKIINATPNISLSLYYFTNGDLDFCREPLLVFKDTGNRPLRGHVTDSQCKPDITAEFDNHWQDDATLGPCVRLAGEKAPQDIQGNAVCADLAGTKWTRIKLRKVDNFSTNPSITDRDHRHE